MHKCICIKIYIWYEHRGAHICIYIYVCVYIYVYICTYIDTYIYVNMHTYIYICKYICIYMYVYIHLHLPFANSSGCALSFLRRKQRSFWRHYHKLRLQVVRFLSQSVCSILELNV